MKRVGSVLIAIAMLCCGAVLHTTTVSADVNSFYFSDFQADYYLSKDSEGRSALRVVEQLTAEFPDFDQNKGIERAIPAVYDGHSVSFKLESLTRNGQPEPVYSQVTKNNNVIIGTGTEEYVRGTQVYQFTYTLRDVTKDFGDHQEFYWDTNGTEWTQSFGQAIARVHLDKTVESAFTDNVACVEGVSQSTKTCSVDKNINPVTFASNGRLAGGENMTVILGFAAGTFAAQPWSPLSLLAYVPIVVFSAAIVVSIYIWRKFGRNAKGRGTIVPEYLPPKNISALLAGELYGAKLKAVTAQIIDLAVRHKIQLIETETQGLFGVSSDYMVKLLDVTDLDEHELSVIDSLFGSRQIGQTYLFKKTDTATGRALEAVTKAVARVSETEEYRKPHKALTYSLVGGIMAMFILLFVVFISFADSGRLSYIAIASFVVGMVAVVVLNATALSLRPLTPKGREVYDYLKGLEMYIKLAEADRLQVLQSPMGAEKTPVDTNDTAQVVKLYERVLPYAVLFGLEREWAKELAIHYDQAGTQPNWYSGSSAFNTAAFAASITSFSSTATSFSSPSSSSSSGLGGGGSSGGGGGGGGGGGR